MARAYPSSQGCKAGAHTIQVTLPIAGHTEMHTHPHSCWDSLDMAINVHIFGMWVGTHTDMWRTCILHTDSGPGQELTFFSHQHYNKATLNEMTLCKDLLFS